MRKISVFGSMLLFLCSPVVALSQVVPKVALFGGATFVFSKNDPNSGYGVSDFHQTGWEGSAEEKVAPWIGMVADVSQQYGTYHGGEKQTIALFGPQFSPKVVPRVIPFAHVLFGLAHGTNQVTTAVPVTGSSATFISIATGTSFATAVGGGLDIKLAGPVWIRVIQADYLHSDLSPDHHTTARLSAGIVFRL